MPRRAKLVVNGDAVPVTSTVGEMQLALERKLQDGKRIRAEAKQLETAIAQARRGEQRERETIFGAMVLADRSEAGRALVAALLERIENPRHRALFGLAPRPDGMLGAAVPSRSEPGPSHGPPNGSRQSIDGPAVAETGGSWPRPEDDGASGISSGPIVADSAVRPGEQAYAMDSGDRDHDHHLGTVNADGTGSFPGRDGPDEDAWEGASSVVVPSPPADITVVHDRPVHPSDGADLDRHTGGVELDERSALPGHGGAAEDPWDTADLAAISAPSGNVVEPGTASHFAPATVLEDGGEVASPPHGTPVSAASEDAKDLATSPFIPRTFLSTFEAKDQIAALGLKKRNRGGGVWTVTGVTSEQVEALAALKLKPYEADDR